MKKLGDVLLNIFSYMMVICLFGGGLSFIGYTIALSIGGEIATNLCLIIFKQYLPTVIKLTSISTGIGLIGMYCSKQKTLTKEHINIETK